MQYFFSRITNLKPATLAILIQCIAFVAVSLIFNGINTVSMIFFHVELNLPFFSLVIAQAILSTLMAYSMNMAIWWRWIHFCFPVAIWVMSQLPIPNTFYLFGFVVTLSLYWTTFRTQVPFFPSTPVIWKEVVKLIPQDKTIRMIDIGSGLGDMSMHVAKVRSNSIVEGIEIAPLPWLVSVLRAKLGGSRAVFKMGDYHALNFADYDVIFAYLSPAAMHALWQKAQVEMRSGSLLVSYEFEIESVPPTRTIRRNHHEKGLYVWEIK